MATVLASSGRAAADQDDWQLAARAGISSVRVENRDPFGLGAGLDLRYGLDDAWAVRVSGSFARLTMDGDMGKMLPGGTVWSYSSFAGLDFSMDVIRLLPTFEAGLGVLGSNGTLKSHAAIGMQAGVGADYLLTPRVSIGGIAEYIYAPFDLIANVLTGNQVPQAFSISARVSWILR